jgi:uncharacterized protein (TIGR02246 family)
MMITSTTPGETPMPVARSLIITAMLALAGCAARPPAPLTQPATDAVAAVAAAWLDAAGRRDADAVAALYTPDALLMSPNRPIVSGREGVRDWFAALPNFTRMTTTLAEVEGRDDLAVARSTFAMTLELPGRPPINERGKILQVLRRQPDGRWLIWRESFSSDTPRPPG